MLEKIDTHRLITDITSPLCNKGVQFHKEKVFHNFLDLAKTPLGQVRLDTWVFSSFLVRPEDMDYLYDQHLGPSAMMMRRWLDRCTRSRALLLLTAEERLPDVIGTVIGDYAEGHVSGVNVNLTNTDVIGSVVEIDDHRFTVIEHDQGQIYLDPLPSKSITNGSQIRAGFRKAQVDFSQGGVTLVTVTIPIPRVLNSIGRNLRVIGPEHLSRPTEIFETDDFCLRASVGWRTSEVAGQEGHYHFTIDFLCGFIVDANKCHLMT